MTKQGKRELKLFIIIIGTLSLNFKAVMWEICLLAMSNKEMMPSTLISLSEISQSVSYLSLASNTFAFITFLNVV